MKGRAIGILRPFSHRFVRFSESGSQPKFDIKSKSKRFDSFWFENLRFFLSADEDSKSIDRAVEGKTNAIRFADSASGEGEVVFKQHNISSAQALAMSDWLLDVDARVIDAIRLAKERGFVSTGDAVIVVTGWVKSTVRSFLRSRKIRFVNFSVRVTARPTRYASSTQIRRSFIPTLNPFLSLPHFISKISSRHLLALSQTVP